MSDSEPSPTAARDEVVAIVVRLGTLIVAVLAISVAVNVFAGGVVFSAGLAALAVYAGIHPARPHRATSVRATRRLRVERRPWEDELSGRA